MRNAIRSGLLAITLTYYTGALAINGEQPSLPTTSLTITGAVERTIVLDSGTLSKYPQQQVVELQLPDKDGGKSSVVRGCRLRDLLDSARILTSDHNTVKKLAVIATSSDGYKVVFSWSELFNSSVGESVLVIFERNGKALSSQEGPLALISGKDLLTGPRHVKWLKTIEVRQIVD